MRVTSLGMEEKPLTTWQSTMMSEGSLKATQGFLWFLLGKLHWALAFIWLVGCFFFNYLVIYFGLVGCFLYTNPIVFLTLNSWLVYLNYQSCHSKSLYHLDRTTKFPPSRPEPGPRFLLPSPWISALSACDSIRKRSTLKPTSSFSPLTPGLSRRQPQWEPGDAAEGHTESGYFFPVHSGFGASEHTQCFWSVLGWVSSASPRSPCESVS